MERSKINNYDQKIEETLWSLPMIEESETTLLRVSGYLLSRLSRFLEVEVTTARQVIIPGQYATIFFYGGTASDKLLNLEWEGRLIIQIFEGEVWVYAKIFIFSNKYRIGLQKDKGQSVLFVDYKRNDQNIGVWSVPQWELDEAGEWESYTHPRLNISKNNNKTNTIL